MKQEKGVKVKILNSQTGFSVSIKSRVNSANSDATGIPGMWNIPTSFGVQ